MISEENYKLCDTCQQTVCYVDHICTSYWEAGGRLGTAQWSVVSGDNGSVQLFRHTCGDTSHPHNNAAPRDPGMWQIADIMQRGGEMETCGHMVMVSYGQRDSDGSGRHSCKCNYADTV